MRGNYDFVPHIDNGISTEWLRDIRQQTVPGSHADNILQESLLDRAYSPDSLKRGLASAANDVIMTSFPNEMYHGHALLFRSEFLILSYIGNDIFDPVMDVDNYVAHIQRKIERSRPREIIYRLCDYNNEDFAFLEQHSGRITSRGAQRLLDQEALLHVDLKVIRAIAEMGIATRLLIPCIQLPQQYEAIRRIIEEELSGVECIVGIGVMLEIPANLFQSESYIDADFYIFGPGDLLKYFYGGLDRNDHIFGGVDIGITLFPIQHWMSQMDRNTHNKEVYLANRCWARNTGWVWSDSRTSALRTYSCLHSLPHGTNKHERQRSDHGIFQLEPFRQRQTDQARQHHQAARGDLARRPCDYRRLRPDLPWLSPGHQQRRRPPPA